MLTHHTWNRKFQDCSALNVDFLRLHTHLRSLNNVPRDSIILPSRVLVTFTLICINYLGGYYTPAMPCITESLRRQVCGECPVHYTASYSSVFVAELNTQILNTDNFLNLKPLLLIPACPFNLWRFACLGARCVSGAYMHLPAVLHRVDRRLLFDFSGNFSYKTQP